MDPKSRNFDHAPRVVVVLLLAASLAVAQEATAPDLMRRADAAFREGRGEEAIRLADAALAADPSNAGWLHRRGEWKFRLGRINASIEDFDEAIRLDPRIEPYSWQRGLAYYYAGKFRQGVRQFEVHQTVNPNDVENAVWHYLCVARAEGVQAARERLIPITGDRRVPMMEVHALFAGQAEPGDVLAAAENGKPAPEELLNRMFYAHLYLGLYYEAHSNAEKSLHHIRQAVEKYPANHYMGDVAQVHLQARQK